MSSTSAVAVGHPAQPWYCCHCSDTQAAYDNLTAQAFHVFWPRYWALDAKRQPTPHSLFGPYLFVPFDRADPAWRAIPNTRGVRRLISLHAELPIQVPTVALQPFIDTYGLSGLREYQPPVVRVDKPCWRKLWEVAAGEQISNNLARLAA